MKKALLISGALLALTSSTALAGGVNFAWTECLSGGGVSNRTFACNTNTGTNVAIGSFMLTQPMADFVSVEVVVDLQAQDPALPAWWTFSPAVGNCRGSVLSMTFDFSVLAGGCADPFGQPATGSLANYSPNGNRARALGVAAIDAGAPAAVSDATEYYGVRMAITNAKTAGAGNCAGCNIPVALVLNSINAVGLTGNEFNGNVIASNCITWQSATAGTCAATPTQNKTWGAIKSIYR
jgi:hypothetical protein